MMSIVHDPLDWLINNKSWLFDGLGVAFLTLLVTFLAKYLHDHPLTKALRDPMREYNKTLSTKCRTWRGLGLGREVNLEDIYVSHSIKLPFSNRKETIPEKVFIQKTFGKSKQNKNSLIEGPPGSGKTTFLKHLTSLLIHPNSETSIPAYIPILLSLNEVSRILSSEQANSISLIQLATEHFKTVCGEIPPGLAGFLSRAVRRGKVIILLDAMDEVPHDSQIIVKAWIENIGASTKCPMILTSRPYELMLGVQGLQSYSIEPFSPNQQNQFITNWFKSSSHPESQELAQKMKKLLDHSDLNIPELGGNPLFLTMMCIEYEVKNELSSTQGLLLNRFVRILLYEWDREKGVVRQNHDNGEPTSPDVQLKILEAIANYFFKQGVFSARETDLTKAISPLLLDLNCHTDASDMLKQIKEISGLLESGDELGTYQFCHSLFQDFFMARYLKEMYYSGGQNNAGKQNISVWIRKNKNNPRCRSIVAFYDELPGSKTGSA